MSVAGLINEIEENFRFLMIEVSKQLEDARESLDHPHHRIADRVLLRDDHIDNLKSIIEKKVYLAIIYSETGNKKLMDFSKSLNVITANLERIGDFCVNIVNQVQYFNNPASIKDYDYQAFFDEINSAFEIITEAVFRNDISLAINICHSEYSLDQLYKNNFEVILKKLQEQKDTQNLLTVLFILRYLERIGDSLLNIGEAVISSIIGEKLKIHQIHALGESLESTEYDYPDPDFSFESIGETKSGCKIGIVQLSDRNGETHEIIFKEGKRYKIEKEYHNLHKWNKISPGTPPGVHGFHVHSLNASLLLEKLEGLTFQELILEEDMSYARSASDILIKHVRNMWQKTKRSGSRQSSLFSQVTKRIDDVLKVHPGFNNPERIIGNIREPSFKELMSFAINIEKKVALPFTTFIHGDFNVDNIICDMEKGKIHYIDLYRSKYSDYVQDASVFIVSNYRIPHFGKDVRDRIDCMISNFYRFSRDYASENNDKSFDFRFSLGIIRSFLTSTRFHLDDEFAKSMYYRAIYLLLKIYHYTGRIEDFRFPEDIIYY